jgi:hypothetical protein
MTQNRENMAKETHTELIVYAKDGRITIQNNYAQ